MRTAPKESRREAGRDAAGNADGDVDRLAAGGCTGVSGTNFKNLLVCTWHSGRVAGSRRISPGGAGTVVVVVVTTAAAAGVPDGRLEVSDLCEGTRDEGREEGVAENMSKDACAERRFGERSDARGVGSTGSKQGGVCRMARTGVSGTLVGSRHGTLGGSRQGVVDTRALR